MKVPFAFTRLESSLIASWMATRDSPMSLSFLLFSALSLFLNLVFFMIRALLSAIDFSWPAIALSSAAFFGLKIFNSALALEISSLASEISYFNSATALSCAIFSEAWTFNSSDFYFDNFAIKSSKALNNSS